MKQKHTPPPYTMRDLGHGVEVRGPDGESIGWFGSSTSVSRDKAITVPHVENAKLFVSAPELMRQRDELVECLYEFVQSGWHNPDCISNDTGKAADCDCGMAGKLMRARDAIFKAKRGDK